MGIEVPWLTTWVQVLPQQVDSNLSKFVPFEMIPKLMIKCRLSSLSKVICSKRIPNHGSHASLWSVVHFGVNHDDP
eukprot:3141692-Amphidinium_carterae.1